MPGGLALWLGAGQVLIIVLHQRSIVVVLVVQVASCRALFALLASGTSGTLLEIAEVVFGGTALAAPHNHRVSQERGVGIVVTLLTRNNSSPIGRLLYVHIKDSIGLTWFSSQGFLTAGIFRPSTLAVGFILDGYIVTLVLWNLTPRIGHWIKNWAN